MRTHYEILPDGTLFVLPIRRSMAEVMQERAKVAVWFSTDPDPEKIEILGGTCSIIKASISVKNNKAVINIPENIPPNIRLQDMIDVDNFLTAEQVIAAYKEHGPIV
jgi:hypothetical protein